LKSTGLDQTELAKSDFRNTATKRPMPGFSPLLQVKEPEVVGAELMAWQQARKQLWFLLQEGCTSVEQRVITHPGFGILAGSVKIMSIN
jgi:hypothetical protein